MARSVRARRSGPLLAALARDLRAASSGADGALRRPPLRPNHLRFARWPGLRGGAPPGQRGCVSLERHGL